MNYVFFDIECANCYQGKGKICSFGYVITDEDFNIIEQHDMIVNPDSKFNLGPEIKLAYTKSEFKHAPLFPMFYDEIDTLLTDPDSLVFGFSVNNDARYVRDDCRRYGLPHINYRFYDVQQMYMCYQGIKNQPSLVGICEQYGIDENQDIHKSDDDARMTMEVLKNLCDITGKSVTELIDEYPRSVGEINDGELRWVYAPPKESKVAAVKSKKVRRRSGNGMSRYSPNYKYFRRFNDNLDICSDSNSPLCGRIICISANYEEKHFRQMIYIVKKLAEQGAIYTSVASRADYFVTYEITKADGTPKICPRLAKVIERAKDDHNIKIVDFNDFVSDAQIDTDELEAFRVEKETDDSSTLDISDGGNVTAV